MKKLILSITIALSLLSFNLQAQSYVNDWPVQSLLPSTKTMEQLNKPNDIPYYLQNHTFRDTTYDTTTWQTIDDIDIVYLKALGNTSSKYCVDIEILEDGSIIIPWYQSGGGGFHITKVDSMGEEIYTKFYDNIVSAQFHIYRKDTILEFVGKFDINGKKRFGMLKYNLNTNDTISVTSLGKVSSAFVLDAINTCQIDSNKYVLSTSDVNSEDYIYIYNNTPELTDSIYFTQNIDMIYWYNDSVYIIIGNGNVYNYSDGVINYAETINSDNIRNGLLVNESLYLVNSLNGILKLDTEFKQQYYAQISNPGFSPHFPNGLFLTRDSLLLAATGVSTSNWLPIDETKSIGLYRLNENGVYINKLYIGGANFSNQQVFELKNGDYLFIANADENQTGNGTIFLMRMKPWQNGVGISKFAQKQELTIYPNPVHNTIKHNIEGVYNYSIYNLMGQLVQSETTNKTQIDVNSLHAGAFVIVIRHGNRSFSNYFIKQ
jgi:hypothetical protein